MIVRSAAWCAVVLVPTVLLGGLWAARRDLTQRNWALPTQMAVSPASQSQSANPVLREHMTMQPPVEGTLARGAQPFHFRNTDADRQRAGRELRNPFPPSLQARDRGRELYQAFCLVCHGEAGRGDGPLIPKYPNPPSFLTESSRKLSDGEMFHIVTMGRNKMPSHASQLPWDDRWHVISYVRSVREANQ